jgi:hypothetical protein
MEWEFRREGRAWTGNECLERLRRVPEKVEMIEGKLYWSHEDRMTMLALLLENVGIDAAVGLGDVGTWQAALDARTERERAGRARVSGLAAGPEEPVNPGGT